MHTQTPRPLRAAQMAQLPHRYAVGTRAVWDHRRR